MVLAVVTARIKPKRLITERISPGVMTSTNEILEFIHRRFPHDCNWLNGNCLWFAFILQKRFPNLEIYYLPIQGHFVTGLNIINDALQNSNIKTVYFDWTGEIEPKEEVWSLSKIKEEDDLLYSHLIRDCLL